MANFGGIIRKVKDIKISPEFQRYNEINKKIGQVGFNGLSPDERDFYTRFMSQMGVGAGLAAPVAGGARALPQFAKTGASTLTRTNLPGRAPIAKGVMPRFKQVGSTMFRDPRQMGAIKRNLAKQGTKFAPQGAAIPSLEAFRNVARGGLRALR